MCGAATKSIRYGIGANELNILNKQYIKTIYHYNEWSENVVVIVLFSNRQFY